MRLAHSLIRLSAFIGLAVFVVDCSFGQVVIQERVEVDPAVTMEGPTSNMGSLRGWQFNTPGRLVVDFNMIATDGLHCGSPLSIWNPRIEFRYSGSRDTVITVPLVPYIANELNPPTSCDLWLIEFEGGFDLGVVEAGDRVEPLYLVHGFEVPLITEVLVPDDAQDNGDGSYLWESNHYISTEDNEPYFEHLYETLDYVAQLEPILDHLLVIADPDTLSVGDAAVLNVEGRQADETPVTLPTGATLDLALDQGGGTVGFLRWNGIEDVVLTGVPAVDLEVGLVEIVASDTGPPALRGEAGADALRQRPSLSDNTEPAANNFAGETTLTVTAKLSNDPTITGSATVTVSAETPTLVLSFALNGSPIDLAVYLPTKDDVIEVTATLIDGPPDATGDVTFSLPDNYEFEFDGAGTTPQVVALVNGEAKVSLNSLTWWGVATVQADYDLEGVPITVDLQIPVDTDGDTIADAWEMLAENGGRLDIAQDGINQDGVWDSESTPGNSHDGDAYTKLEEYMGILAGATFMRLTPERKEVPINLALAQNAPDIIVALQSLEIDGIDVSGGYQTNGGRSGIMLVRDRTINPQNPNDNGIFFLNGVLQQGPYGGGLLGVTARTQGTYGEGVSNVFRETIHNLYTANTFPERPTDQNGIFRQQWVEWPMATSARPEGWRMFAALFDGTDHSGDSDLYVNPFDILGPAVYQNGRPVLRMDEPEDGFINGTIEALALRRTSIHEAAHQLNLNHPCPQANVNDPSTWVVCRWSPDTAMHEGVYQVTTFSSDDEAEARLK